MVGMMEEGLRVYTCLLYTSHAEEGNDPHPEDGAGTAGEDGAARADDVAGTTLGRNGGGPGLEGAHAGLVLLAVE